MDDFACTPVTPIHFVFYKSYSMYGGLRKLQNGHNVSSGHIARQNSVVGSISEEQPSSVEVNLNAPNCNGTLYNASWVDAVHSTLEYNHFIWVAGCSPVHNAVNGNRSRH